MNSTLQDRLVRAVESRGERGYDPGKKIKGRKRHLLVDTLSFISAIVVTVASVQDRDGGKLVFASAGEQARLKKVWADRRLSRRACGQDGGKLCLGIGDCYPRTGPAEVRSIASTLGRRAHLRLAAK
jgi:hypothetical protein